jgi:hypothetical protein
VLGAASAEEGEGARSEQADYEQCHERGDQASGAVGAIVADAD